MWEIFIPEKIFDIIHINNIWENILQIFEKHFWKYTKQSFESTYCKWIKFEFEQLDQDLVSILNGEFGKFYFIDYNFDKQNIITHGKKILWIWDIWDEIKSIENKFEKIIQELSSNNLLTISKKEKIHKNIKETFFTISWILFLLYWLKQKIIENLNDLENIDDNQIELKSQAALLRENNITKKIEIQAQIYTFEAKSQLFFQTIHSLLL